MSVRNPNGLRVAFMHPDLGIGGAERLVVDAAVALQQYGHIVHMFTSHHEENHSFEETKKIGGCLKVVVAGDWLPRTVFGKFAIVFAMLRGIWLSLYLLFNWTQHNPLIKFGNSLYNANKDLIGMLTRAQLIFLNIFWTIFEHFLNIFWAFFGFFLDYFAPFFTFFDFIVVVFFDFLIFDLLLGIVFFHHNFLDKNKSNDTQS